MDHALDRASEAKVAHLLEQCPGAKVYKEQLLRLDAKIKALPSLKPPDVIKQRIDNAIINRGSKAIRDRGSANVRSHRWMYILSSAFIVIAAVTITFSIKRYNSTRQTETMFAAMDMYQHMDLYEHMDMMEHLQEVMAINQTPKNSRGVK
jgi:hypothetical protein